MPTLHPMPARPPQPSRYQDGYCETPYCWTRESVFYDHEIRKHQCNRCWSRRAGFQAAVLPLVGAPAKLIPIDRYTAATLRHRR